LLCAIKNQKQPTFRDSPSIQHSRRSPSRCCIPPPPPATTATVSLAVVTKPSMTLSLYSSSKHKVPSTFKCFLMGHRTIQARRDLRRSLVQAPAPSGASCEVQLGCLGLCAVRSWKPPRMETPQPPRATCAPTWPAGLGVKKLSVTSMNLSRFGWCPRSLILPPCTMGKSLG